MNTVLTVLSIRYSTLQWWQQKRRSWPTVALVIFFLICKLDWSKCSPPKLSLMQRHALSTQSVLPPIDFSITNGALKSILLDLSSKLHINDKSCCKYQKVSKIAILNLISTRLKSALRARPRWARMEFTSRLTSSTPMVRTHTLNPTSDAPRP